MSQRIYITAATGIDEEAVVYSLDQDTYDSPSEKDTQTVQLEADGRGYIDTSYAGTNEIVSVKLQTTDGDVIGNYYAYLNGTHSDCADTVAEALLADIGAADNITIDTLSPGAMSQLLGADITVTQPIDSAGQIRLTRGMDYSNTDGRALEFTDDKNQWPDLDTATVALVCWRDGANALSFPGSAPVPTGSTKKVRFELASADTQKLSRGEWRYGVQAVISTRTIDLVRPGKSLSVIQFN